MGGGNQLPLSKTYVSCHQIKKKLLVSAMNVMMSYNMAITNASRNRNHLSKRRNNFEYNLLPIRLII